MTPFFDCTVALLVATSVAASGAAFAQEPVTVVPHSPGQPYAAKGLPDRVVLTPGADPSTAMAVAWRTDVRQAAAMAEIAPAIDGPSIASFAMPVTGTSLDLTSENGPSRYHHARFDGLTPNTAYLYRVKGADGWSEWLQFRTAAAEAKPFTFLYFGDTQNGILPIGSRVIRQAFLNTAAPALAVHAGDLVAQRDDLVHDDEWGEWTQSGGYAFSMIPQLPAPGNHEYVDDIQPDGSEKRRLGPHWTASFALPANGAQGAAATTYYADYQGVRFIILDGTSAIDLGTIDAQTRWLDATLAASKADWNVVLFHQPIFTCARPNDTAELKTAWKPVFEKHDVDLVLQGHDHCYSRLTAEQGASDGRAKRASGAAQGPVYLVSVTGKKMYALNNRALTQPDRVAEDTELYQVFHVEPNRIGFRAYTASGKLYDSFEMTRGADGRKMLTEQTDDLLPLRTCRGDVGPDGAPCTARGK
ncbi:fibronectin type III domain-containing protein [Blastomonas sp.]|uniref:fibronectin type III domain-containing protein n=1 Tax=Blastomonas sp. TaxID=1909299 RepID=UPI0035932B63